MSFGFNFDVGIFCCVCGDESKCNNFNDPFYQLHLKIWMRMRVLTHIHGAILNMPCVVSFIHSFVSLHSFDTWVFLCMHNCLAYWLYAINLNDTDAVVVVVVAAAAVAHAKFTQLFDVVYHLSLIDDSLNLSISRIRYGFH